jgi:branched-chain amino acid transport system ATP-binding protein
MFTGASLRKPDSTESDRVQSLLKLLSLTEVADIPVDALPLGTTRLVEVGRALATSPTVLLLDEPSAGLDQREAARLSDALHRTVVDERISMLLVEHDVAMVLSLCSHVFVLDFGELLADGPPDAIRNNAAVKAAYLGDGLADEATGNDDSAQGENEAEVASPR